MWVTWVRDIRKSLEEGVEFHPEWKAEGGLKFERGGSLKDCVLSCFPNMALECTVPSSLSQPTLEPYRKLTIFCFRSSDVLSWWFKCYIIMYTFSNCWHSFMSVDTYFPSWWWQQYWDSVCTMLAIWDHVARFVLILQIEHLSCPGDARISLLNFPLKVQPESFFHLCLRAVNKMWMLNFSQCLFMLSPDVWILFFVLIIYKMLGNSKNILVYWKYCVVPSKI